jgi:exodeoxyribonuclease-3
VLASGAPIVLAGDYNVMPTEFDVYAPERWIDDALFRPEVREAFPRLTGHVGTDALRALHPNERIYTFWKYPERVCAGCRTTHRSSAAQPVGCRSPGRAGVDRAVRSREHASDHAPAWIEIADTKSGPPRRGRRVVASAP